MNFDFMFKKYSSIILFTILLLCFACKDIVETKIQGNAQGTTYSIIYFDQNGINYKAKIDSILNQIDLTASIYNANSTISLINSNNSDYKLNNHFINIFNKSKEISKLSGGLFDPTVAPLVNVYGFGNKKKTNISQKIVDSIMQFVGFSNINIVNNQIVKKDPRVELDFNAIAQGYTVDVISDFFKSKDINNYIIELGGEIYASGKKKNGDWIVGVEKPSENITDDQIVKIRINLKNKAIATSGNYRKYYSENGIKFSHHINPLTGKSEYDSLLSVSVISNNCTTSDALGTAFLLMGIDKSLDFISNNPQLNIDAYFIYKNHKNTFKTLMSKGFEKYIIKD